jgi:ribosomal protein L32E
MGRTIRNDTDKQRDRQTGRQSLFYIIHYNSKEIRHSQPHCYRAVMVEVTSVSVCSKLFL